MTLFISFKSILILFHLHFDIFILPYFSPKMFLMHDVNPLKLPFIFKSQINLPFLTNRVTPLTVYLRGINLRRALTPALTWMCSFEATAKALPVICSWKQRFCAAIKLPLDMEN